MAAAAQGAGVVAFTISVPVEVVLAQHSLHAGAAGYGAMLSGWGAGAVVGSAAYARWRRVHARDRQTVDDLRGRSHHGARVPSRLHADSGEPRAGHRQDQRFPRTRPQPSWYSDTGITIGDKDSYQNLRGVWIYGLDELDSLKRGELTKTKNFLTATRDRYRPSYARRARDFPRGTISAARRTKTPTSATPPAPALLARARRPRDRPRRARRRA